MRLQILALTLLGAGLSCAQAAVPSPVDVYTRTIQVLGGNVVNPLLFPNTVTGFQDYLFKTGISALSAADLTRPNHPDVAARLGFREFLPPQNWWARGAALALLTQSINTHIGDVVHVRNWWRPAAYNADPAVGGAKDGDHPTANAVDLDYRLASQRIRAEAFLRDLAKRCPWMQLSLGLGPQTTHIGIGSPRGHREWHYAGWRPATLQHAS